MLCLGNKLENALKRLWRFRLSLSGCHGGKTSSDLSAGSWFSVPSTQVWSNSSNMDEWELCSSDFLYSHLLFHTKEGLSVFLPLTSWFPSVSHSCPSPTISSHGMPSQPASSSQVPHGCFFTSPEVVGGSFSSLRHISAIYIISVLFPLSVSHCCFLPASSSLSFIFLFHPLLVVPCPSSKDKYVLGCPPKYYLHEMKRDNISAVWQGCCGLNCVLRWQTDLLCHYVIEVARSLGFFKSHSSHKSYLEFLYYERSKEENTMHLSTTLVVIKK